MPTTHGPTADRCIMRMGNFMCPGDIGLPVMAARPRRTGIRHLTVVPTNYEPPVDAEEATVETEADAEPSSV
mgnify:CR=1 FL=1